MPPLNLPKPYYQTDKITLYHADCEELLPLLPNNYVDAVVTDPPYGIAKQWQGGENNGWKQIGKQKQQRNNWDEIPPNDIVMSHIIRVGETKIIWGGNYFNLPSSRCWLLWVKPERGFTLAEAEMAWTNIDKPVRCFDFARHIANREHPTQKPVEVITWAMSHLPSEAKTVLDPYAGSGTTAIACLQLDKRCVLIEREKEYCDIIVKRLTRTVGYKFAENKFAKQQNTAISARLKQLSKRKK